MVPGFAIRADSLSADAFAKLGVPIFSSLAFLEVLAHALAEFKVEHLVDWALLELSAVASAAALAPFKAWWAVAGFADALAQIRVPLVSVSALDDDVADTLTASPVPPLVNWAYLGE